LRSPSAGRGSASQGGKASASSQQHHQIDANELKPHFGAALMGDLKGVPKSQEDNEMSNKQRSQLHAYWEEKGIGCGK
jgi:hypothetical protein